MECSKLKEFIESMFPQKSGVIELLHDNKKEKAFDRLKILPFKSAQLNDKNLNARSEEIVNKLLKLDTSAASKLQHMSITMTSNDVKKLDSNMYFCLLLCYLDVIHCDMQNKDQCKRYINNTTLTKEQVQAFFIAIVNQIYYPYCSKQGGAEKEFEVSIDKYKFIPQFEKSQNQMMGNYEELLTNLQNIGNQVYELIKSVKTQKVAIQYQDARVVQLILQQLYIIIANMPSIDYKAIQEYFTSNASIGTMKIQIQALTDILEKLKSQLSKSQQKQQLIPFVDNAIKSSKEFQNIIPNIYQSAGDQKLQQKSYLSYFEIQKYKNMFENLRTWIQVFNNYLSLEITMKDVIDKDSEFYQQYKEKLQMLNALIMKKYHSEKMTIAQPVYPQFVQNREKVVFSFIQLACEIEMILYACSNKLLTEQQKGKINSLQINDIIGDSFNITAFFQTLQKMSFTPSANADPYGNYGGDIAATGLETTNRKAATGQSISSNQYSTIYIDGTTATRDVKLPANPTVFNNPDAMIMNFMIPHLQSIGMFRRLLLLFYEIFTSLLSVEDCKKYGISILVSQDQKGQITPDMFVKIMMLYISYQSIYQNNKYPQIVTDSKGTPVATTVATSECSIANMIDFINRSYGANHTKYLNRADDSQGIPISNMCNQFYQDTLNSMYSFILLHTKGTQYETISSGFNNNTVRRRIIYGGNIINVANISDSDIAQAFRQDPDFIIDGLLYYYFIEHAILNIVFAKDKLSQEITEIYKINRSTGGVVASTAVERLRALKILTSINQSQSNKSKQQKLEFFVQYISGLLQYETKLINPQEVGDIQSILDNKYIQKDYQKAITGISTLDTNTIIENFTLNYQSLKHFSDKFTQYFAGQLKEVDPDSLQQYIQWKESNIQLINKSKSDQDLQAKIFDTIFNNAKSQQFTIIELLKQFIGGIGTTQPLASLIKNMEESMAANYNQTISISSQGLDLINDQFQFNFAVENVQTMTNGMLTLSDMFRLSDNQKIMNNITQIQTNIDNVYKATKNGQLSKNLLIKQILMKQKNILMQSNNMLSMGYDQLSILQMFQTDQTQTLSEYIPNKFSSQLDFVISRINRLCLDKQLHQYYVPELIHSNLKLLLNSKDIKVINPQIECLNPQSVVGYYSTFTSPLVATKSGLTAIVQSEYYKETVQIEPINSKLLDFEVTIPVLAGGFIATYASDESKIVGGGASKINPANIAYFPNSMLHINPITNDNNTAKTYADLIGDKDKGAGKAIIVDITANPTPPASDSRYLNNYLYKLQTSNYFIKNDMYTNIATSLDKLIIDDNQFQYQQFLNVIDILIQNPITKTPNILDDIQQINKLHMGHNIEGLKDLLSKDITQARFAILQYLSKQIYALSTDDTNIVEMQGNNKVINYIQGRKYKDFEQDCDFALLIHNINDAGESTTGEIMKSYYDSKIPAGLFNKYGTGGNVFNNQTIGTSATSNIDSDQVTMAAIVTPFYAQAWTDEFKKYNTDQKYLICDMHKFMYQKDLSIQGSFLDNAQLIKNAIPDDIVGVDKELEKFDSSTKKEATSRAIYTALFDQQNYTADDKIQFLAIKEVTPQKCTLIIKKKYIQLIKRVMDKISHIYDTLGTHAHDEKISTLQFIISQMEHDHNYFISLPGLLFVSGAVIALYRFISQFAIDQIERIHNIKIDYATPAEIQELLTHGGQDNSIIKMASVTVETVVMTLQANKMELSKQIENVSDKGKITKVDRQVTLIDSMSSISKQQQQIIYVSAKTLIFINKIVQQAYVDNILVMYKACNDILQYMQGFVPKFDQIVPDQFNFDQYKTYADEYIPDNDMLFKTIDTYDILNAINGGGTDIPYARGNSQLNLITQQYITDSPLSFVLANISLQNNEYLEAIPYYKLLLAQQQDYNKNILKKIIISLHNISLFQSLIQSSLRLMYVNLRPQIILYPLSIVQQPTVTVQQMLSTTYITKTQGPVNINNQVRMNRAAVIANNILPIGINKIFNSEYLNISKLSGNITSDQLGHSFFVVDDKNNRKPYLTQIFQIKDAITYDLLNDNFAKNYVSNDGTLDVAELSNAKTSRLVTPELLKPDSEILSLFTSYDYEIASPQVLQYTKHISNLLDKMRISALYNTLQNDEMVCAIRNVPISVFLTIAPTYLNTAVSVFNILVGRIRATIVTVCNEDNTGQLDYDTLRSAAIGLAPGQMADAAIFNNLATGNATATATAILTDYPTGAGVNNSTTALFTSDINPMYRKQILKGDFQKIITYFSTDGTKAIHATNNNLAKLGYQIISKDGRESEIITDIAINRTPDMKYFTDWNDGTHSSADGTTNIGATVATSTRRIALTQQQSAAIMGVLLIDKQFRAPQLAAKFRVIQTVPYNNPLTYNLFKSLVVYDKMRSNIDETAGNQMQQQTYDFDQYTSLLMQ